MKLKPRHIFFSPHADDVVLSCGGTIHSLVSRNESVAVVGVFAGEINEPASAYARHLHSKWRLGEAAIEERWQEDCAAMKLLGVENVERWNYIEAPYRSNETGPFYASNEELVGRVAAADQSLRDDLARQIAEYLKNSEVEARLYFPLAVGDHVDHQLLFDIGLEMAAAGRQVRFYEDSPYVESYVANGHREWRSEVLPIHVRSKARAAAAYESQLYGMGGSASALEVRIRSTSMGVGKGKPAERFWRIESSDAKRVRTEDYAERSPFVKKQEAFRLRDFSRFLRTFRWHDLPEILPLGSRSCLDVGAGSGRHKSVVESRGYNWVGLDSLRAADVRADAACLPVRSESQAAVIAWQVMEYVENPTQVFAEVARVLEPGGVFCGSVSFLEPVHGRTYFNLSPHILEKLLIRNGFGDTVIKPGLNGFALILWTGLRRCGVPALARLALPLAFLMLAPFAAVLYVASWFSWRVGVGTGHLMRWISQIAPLEFAGHVMFCARKRARS